MAPEPTQPKRSPRRQSSFALPKLIFSELVPSRTAAVEAALGRMLEAIRRRTSVDGKGSAIEIALREALVNSIVHGHRGKRRTPVELECFLEKERSLLLIVRDQGPGFDLAAIADATETDHVLAETGRGIALIRHFMDEVEFARSGREIRLRKRL